MNTLFNALPPEAREMEFLNAVRGVLEKAVESKDGVAGMIRFKPTSPDAKFPNTGYTAAYLSNFTMFRVRIRAGEQCIFIPDTFQDLIPAGVPWRKVKSEKGYFRLVINPEHPAEGYTDFLARIAGETVSRYPKEWDCCSRYMECSDAKACVHPDKAFALGCGYRRILASGRIFYGANRNID